jgi:iron complex transport system ATP-binding protein
VTSLSTTGLVIERGGRRILGGVSMELAAGSVLAIVGPNGSGKSTLLRGMAGLWEAVEGTVTYDGRDIRHLHRQEIARLITYVPQEVHFGFEFSVREIVLMGRYPYRGRFEREKDEDIKASDEAMKRADVVHLADRSVTALSGGERQRVLIARSLATRARVLLLDEPTANLDIDHSLEILELCRSLADEGRAVAIATHDLNAVCRFADQVALVDSGAIVAKGPADAVLTAENLKRVFNVHSEMLIGPGGTPTLVFRRLGG